MTPDTPPARQQVGEAVRYRLIDAREAWQRDSADMRSEVDMFLDFHASETAALVSRADEAERDANKAEDREQEARGLLKRWSDAPACSDTYARLLDDTRAFLSLTPAAPGAGGPKPGDIVAVMPREGGEYAMCWRGAVGRIERRSIRREPSLVVEYAPNNPHFRADTPPANRACSVEAAELRLATPQERAAAGLPVASNITADNSRVIDKNADAAASEARPKRVRLLRDFGGCDLMKKGVCLDVDGWDEDGPRVICGGEDHARYQLRPGEWEAVPPTPPVSDAGEIGALTFHALRSLNVPRVAAFGQTLASWSPMEWACAAAGEMGELCNVLKKRSRKEDPRRPGRDITGKPIPTLRDVADEIADVVIYLDLLAAREGIDVAEAVARKWNETSEKMGHAPRLLLARPATEKGGA